jgi:hypothetical protein
VAREAAGGPSSELARKRQGSPKPVHSSLLVACFHPRNPSSPAAERHPSTPTSGGRVAPLIAAGTALLPRIAGPTVGNEANTRQAVTQVGLTARSETVGGAILPPPAAGSGHALPGGALRQVGCRRPRLSRRRWLATPLGARPRDPRTGGTAATEDPFEPAPRPTRPLPPTDRVTWTR